MVVNLSIFLNYSWKECHLSYFVRNSFLLPYKFSLLPEYRFDAKMCGSETSMQYVQLMDISLKSYMLGIFPVQLKTNFVLFEA